MPVDAFLLALGAAMLHAGWNVLLAKAQDVRAATTVALLVGVVAFAPFAAAWWRVEAAAVPWIALSVALELAYFVFLTAAYRGSDLSLVYPIARGVAPVLVLLGASIAGAALGAVEAVGVIVVGTGVLLVRGPLALEALSLASAPSVAAVRETSVLFAVALGAIALHERVTPWRAAGAALVVAGVALVAV